MNKAIAPVLMVLGLALALPAMGQRRPELNTQAAVDEHVSNALAAEKAQGKLAELALKLGLRGSFTFDLTVSDKGTTETVFQVDSTIESIPDRNHLKDYLMSLKFDFKVPKGKRFKTRQTLVFP